MFCYESQAESYLIHSNVRSLLQVEDIFQFLWFGGLNPYDLYRDCDPNPDINDVRMSAIRRGLFPRKFLSEPSMKKHNTDDNNLISLRRVWILFAKECISNSVLIKGSISSLYLLTSNFYRQLEPILLTCTT